MCTEYTEVLAGRRAVRGGMHALQLPARAVYAVDRGVHARNERICTSVNAGVTVTRRQRSYAES